MKAEDKQAIEDERYYGSIFERAQKYVDEYIEFYTKNPNGYFVRDCQRTLVKYIVYHTSTAKYKDASSELLLQRCIKELKEKHWGKQNERTD